MKHGHGDLYFLCMFLSIYINKNELQNIFVMLIYLGRQKFEFVFLKIFDTLRIDKLCCRQKESCFLSLNVLKNKPFYSAFLNLHVCCRTSSHS